MKKEIGELTNLKLTLDIAQRHINSRKQEITYLDGFLKKKTEQNKTLK